MKNENTKSDKKNTVTLTLGKRCRICQPKHHSFITSKYNLAEKGIFALGKYDEDKKEDKERFMFFPYETVYNVTFEADEAKEQSIA